MKRFVQSLLLALSFTSAIGFSQIATAAPVTVQAQKQEQARTATNGAFARYIVTPRGQVRGILFQDGTIAKFSPKTFDKSIALKEGDLLQVEGKLINTSTGRIMVRSVVTKDGLMVANGIAAPARTPHKRVPGQAHQHKKDGIKLQKIEVTSTIAGFMAGPRGKITALLLSDGTTAYSFKGGKLGKLGLKIGDTVTVAGKGGSYPEGKALMIRKLTLPDGKIEILGSHHHKGKKPAQTQAPAAQ